MESFTADVVESLGGEKGVSPNFEYWAKKGLLFNHAYAASDRTYKGIVAILSGFPNQGTRNIIEENDKQAKLPAISNTLAKEGYHNSFYYGGELEFANIKSYIYSHRIKKITDIADFEKKDLGSKWGAHDDALYKRVLEKLKNEPQPFFAGLLTLSNHEPFDLPSKHKFGKSTNALAFKSTSYYADSCLHSFLAQASQKAWYKNTLIVITGDHGSPLPRGYINNYEPGRFRIPILFLGGALKKSCEGMVYSKTVNQLDLAATILSQMNLPNHDFFWSRNIFSKNYSPNALFVFNNGFGIVSKNDTLLYDANSAKIISYKGNNSQKDSLLKKGRAYFQLGFQQYLDY